MDIKVKGTTKAGILAFDLNDPQGADQMEEANNAPFMRLALTEFLEKLRGIRKYDKLPDIPDISFTPELTQAIKDSEEYYRFLFLEILEECDVLKHI